MTASEPHPRTARSLAGLATTLSALAGAEDRDDLFRRLFRHGPAALESDALAVVLLEAGGRRLRVVDVHDPDGARIGLRLTVDPSALHAAALSEQRVLEPDPAREGAPPAPFRGARAWAVLPLRVGRRPLGCVTVGWDRPREFGDDDLRILDAFAVQCAQGLDRVARLAVERRQASATRGLVETLQRSLLTEPPQPPLLDIAVRYRPAAREAQIGGDWYDAFPLPTGGTTLVVGDVTGHDQTAAVVAGQLRSMLRGIVFALDDPCPDRILGKLDGALHHTGMSTLATALVVHVEECDDDTAASHTLRWSNAGHPPPLFVAHDGAGRLLERPADLLLGVAAEAPRREHAVPLRAGDTVLLYTDGLVERRDATLDDGLGRLLAVSPALSRRPVAEVCDEVLARLGPDLIDDIALLAVRVRAQRRRQP